MRANSSAKLDKLIFKLLPAMSDCLDLPCVESYFWYSAHCRQISLWLDWVEESTGKRFDIVDHKYNMACPRIPYEHQI